jgi:hypothetical protein
METTLKICDDNNIFDLTYNEMCKYHGKDFYGGVALAFKVLQLALEKLATDSIPHREKIRLIIGLNPPGIIDGIEYITRALTRQRLIIDPHVGIGPESVFGSYYFEIHYEQRKIAMTLKEGILPPDFLDLARKCLGGIASPEEIARWKTYKAELGDIIMSLSPQSLFDIIYIQ